MDRFVAELDSGILDKEMKQIYKSNTEFRNVAGWTAKGEAPSNDLNEFKDAFRQNMLVKTKSEAGLRTDDVSGHAEVKDEDQEADKDHITVARKQQAQSASKRRSQFAYSLAIVPTAIADQVTAALTGCDEMTNWKGAWRETHRY